MPGTGPEQEASAAGDDDRALVERGPRGLRRAVRERIARMRRRRLPVIEAAFGLAFALALVVNGGTRAIFRVWLTVAYDVALSLIPLLRVDGAGTAADLGRMIGRIALALVPSVILIRRSPGHRRIWLAPAVILLAVVSSPVSLAACATISRWLLLALVSAVAAALIRVRFFGWTVVLPFVVLWEVAPSHGSTGENADDRERLLAECARHEGERPVNLTADRVMPRHGINSLGDDLVLLTGEGPNDGGMRGRAGGRLVTSWWMRRRDGRFEFERRSEATGNLWRGCSLDGFIWMARANGAVGVGRLPEGRPSHEEVKRLVLPAGDIDFGETACDPDRHRLYVTEATKGGMWELTPGQREVVRHEIGGVILLPKRRRDGRLVVSSTASIKVFAPAEARVVERVPTALVSGGFDVCDIDGSAAVADVTGRLRVFTLDGEGRYRFRWAIHIFAPRRVAYSRDCSRIAVTSADDHRVFVIDASARRVLDTFTAGPALREVAPTGPREFSVTDVCAMTTYRW